MKAMHVEGARFVFNTADYVGAGAIYVPVFEKEILDLTRKRGIALQRVKTKKATGHPTRYIEKVAGTNKANFVNPRNLTHGLDTVPQRVEKSALIRAIVNGITFGKFDVEVTNQQDLFNDLQAEDLQEMVNDMLRIQDEKFWTGAAENLNDANSAEYCGVLKQITKTGTIADGVRMVQGIKSMVAELMANKQYDVMPSAIYMNPLTLDRLEIEEMDAQDKVKFYDVEVVAGIKVRGIMTAAGILPIIADPFLPVVDKGTAYEHKIVIVSENLIERQYVTADVPRIYQLGTDASLAQKFVGVLFDTIIVKGADVGHAILTKTIAK